MGVGWITGLRLGTGDKFCIGGRVLRGLRAKFGPGVTP